MNKHSTYLIVIFWFIAYALSAQNFKYNTEQFGIKGSLLGGAIVAGSDDMSMVYYNPAAIHNIVSRVEISLIQPRINSFGFKQFWGSGEQSKPKTSFELKPLQIAFKTKFKGLELAFIKINKSNWDDKFKASQEDVNSNLKQKRFFEYKYQGSNSWYGLGTSFKLKPNLYVGFTQFLSIARFSYRNEILTETRDVNTNLNEPTNYFQSYTNSNYSNLEFITKIGLIYNTEKHDFGFTITTPTYLRFLKNGDFNQSRIGLGTGSSSIDGTIDLELEPRIKTPWEFNLGYSFLLNEKRKLWLNASYHTKIDEYVITKIQSTDKVLELTSGNKSTFNYGIGYSNQISEKINLSGGIRINNFAYENKAPRKGTVRNILLDGNSLHLSLGAKLKSKKHTLLFGFDWGTLISVPDKENFNLIENISQLETNTIGLTKKSINILLTYGFILDGLTKQTTHNKK